MGRKNRNYIIAVKSKKLLSKQKVFARGLDVFEFLVDLHIKGS